MSGTLHTATSISDGARAALPAAVLPAEGWSTRLLTGVGTALDAAVVRAMQLVVERALIPDAEDVDALRESARATLAPDLLAEPRRFFDFLDEPPHPLRMRSRFRRRIQGGSVIARRIESDYRPHIAGIDGSRGPILVEHWLHETGRPRGTVLALHGFTMGNPRIDSTVLMASHWYRRGLDVALLTLPHHGARTPLDARFSGERFAVPHVAQLSEGVRESLYEIRQILHWLREESGAPAGVLGLSLGGYLAALSAALLDDLDFAIPIVPPVCIGDLAWRFFEGTRHHQQGGTASLSQQELRRSFQVHSPLSHGLAIDRARTMIVAGRGDRIVPPEHPAALWRHWGQPRIHWFSGSHLAPFGRGGMVKAICGHLEAIGIL